MATFTMTKNWDDGQALTESMLDDIKTSTETFLNTTKINSDNIQTGGIATANYAAASVDAAALGTAAVTTAKIQDAAVTQAKLAARATGTTVAAGGVGISSSSGSYTTSSTSYADVTNLSITITTTGRPIKIEIIPSDSAAMQIGAQGGNFAGTFKILRDATDIGLVLWDGDDEHYHGFSITNVDTSAAGTYTFKVQAKSNTGATFYFANARLLVYEL